MAAKTKSKKLTDEELLSPLPAIVLPKKEEVVFPSADNTLAAQKEFLELRLAAVLKMEMTEANIEKVRTIKKGIVSWRNAFDKQVKDYTKAVYKAPMDIFKTAADAVMDDISEMEAQCDKILNKEEEKRRAQVNAAIDGIIEDLRDEIKIDFEPERKKEYYNKTADMKAVAQDLREQFNAKAAELRQHEADIRMIERACKCDERLNTQMYVDQLQYEAASVIIEKIEAEKERLENLDKPKEETPAAPSPAPASFDNMEPVTVGVKVNPVKTDFPGLNKKMTLELEYPVDLADELNRIFGELRKNGVKMRVIKVQEPEIPAF